LARIIKVESSYRQRSLLQKSIVMAIRELANQQEVNDLTHDLAAYVFLSLQAIARSIDPSVSAWEKRGYWLKADRFRLEWFWTEELSRKLKDSLILGDWNKVAIVITQIADKLKNVEPPKRNRYGTPWVGAWDVMMKGL